MILCVSSMFYSHTHRQLGLRFYIRMMGGAAPEAVMAFQLGLKSPSLSVYAWLFDLEQCVQVRSSFGDGLDRGVFVRVKSDVVR